MNPVEALALRLEGPLQSWGLRVQGDAVPTSPVPTRSGVAGLLGAARGVERGAGQARALADLEARFLMIVRVDRPGVAREDFHTVQNVPSGDGARVKGTVITRRAYLHDASFAVLLVATAPGSLDGFAAALARPVWAPYLGRRSCPPSEPLLARPALLAGAWPMLLDDLPRAARATGDTVHLDAALVATGVPAGYTELRRAVQEDAFTPRAVVTLRRAAERLDAADTTADWMPGDAPVDRDTTKEWFA